MEDKYHEKNLQREKEENSDVFFQIVRHSG